MFNILPVEANQAIPAATGTCLMHLHVLWTFAFLLAPKLRIKVVANSNTTGVFETAIDPRMEAPALYLILARTLVAQQVACLIWVYQQIQYQLKGVSDRLAHRTSCSIIDSDLKLAVTFQNLERIRT